MQRLTPIVRNLLLINIGIFLAQRLLGLDLIRLLGLRYVFSEVFRPYQLFTHLFVHANLGHLFSNMFALFMFGPILEHTLTSKRFINFYLLTGLGAALLYAGIQYVEISQLETSYHAYVAQPTPQSLVAYLKSFPQSTYNAFYPFIAAFGEHPNDPTYIAESKSLAYQLYTFKADMPTVGASGSVFGIFMAFAMLFPNVELFIYFIPIPIKAKYVIALYGAYELYAGLKGNPADNVAHFAHLGGLLVAYFFIRWWQKRRYN
ncbi:MAG: rhomboid family intramembrane serine protease [Bacteroidota bacterium]